MVPVCEWLERHFIDPESVNLEQWDFTKAKLIRLEPHQRRILTHLLTPDPETGRFPYREIVWSQPKKSGKTAIAAAVCAWFGAEVESPNQALIAANDYEQSKGRIFMSMAPTIFQLTGNFPIAKTAKAEVRLRNGTVLRAVAGDYAGEAGANYGATFWSELWAYTSERAKRLFDELMPVPTRLNSFRWIETYAGFEDESTLLLELFLRIFTDTSEKKLQKGASKVPGLEDLPCYHVPEQGLFVFWDHEWRMPWQTQAFMREMKEGFARKTTTWTRLGENRWQSSEDNFVPADWVDASLTLDGPTMNEEMVIAVDAAISGDDAALVGMRARHRQSLTSQGKGNETAEPQIVYETAYACQWDPADYKSDEFPKGKLDLDTTIGDKLRELKKAGLIRGKVRYDTYQLETLMTNLAKEGIESEPFPQGNQRTESDTLLYVLYRDGLIKNYADERFERHIKGAKSRELGDNRLRLEKGGVSGTNKIDAAVTQGMACWAASKEPLFPATAALSNATKGSTRDQRVGGLAILRELAGDDD